MIVSFLPKLLGGEQEGGLIFPKSGSRLGERGVDPNWISLAVIPATQDALVLKMSGSHCM